MKAKFWAVGLASFLVFCVVPASAFAGSISGKVTNKATGLPMDEVTACAENPEGSGFCVGVPESGKYTIGGLEAGEYQVSFQPSSELNFVREYYPGTTHFDDATVISLESSEDKTEINVAIEEGATLSGTVVGEGGAGPLEEVEVCAEEEVGTAVYCEPTDSDGKYEIVGIPAGSYQVAFESESESGRLEYAPRFYDEKGFEIEAENVELEAGQGFTANATMVRSGSIEGIVTEDGRPREFVFVCIYTPAEVEVGCTFTEDDGSYRLEDLPVGSYILELESFGEVLQFSGGAKTFAEATPLTVEAETTAIENFELAAPPGISGTVTDALTGDPIDEGEACASAPIVPTHCVPIFDGEYTISVDPGTYEVYFEIEGYVRQFWDGVTAESELTPVVVGESMVSGIDAEMSHAGEITGQVTLAGAGTNLSGVEVCAFDQSGVLVGCGGSSSSAGEYTIGELPAGEYKLRFTRSGYGTQYYDGKATMAEAEPVTVVASETTTGIDAAMVELVKPANISPPELSGVGKVGETLSCTQGVWANNPTRYEFYWLRNGGEIRLAEADTYELTPFDSGKTIKCGVLAESSAGRSSVIQSAASINVLAIRQLTVATVGPGTVTSAPAGIECGSTCATSGNEGEVVTLTAVPASHFELTGWSGACAGVGTCEVTFGATDSSVTATFGQIAHPVSVTVTGSGSVSADSGAIGGCTEAGGTCSGSYDEGTEVTLTATPDAQHTFAGWTGCTTESGTECKVTVEAAEDVTANFAPITHQLTVAKSGDGSGTVTSSPAGIDCGATCAADFDEEASVTLTAVADPGSEFTGWSGAGCSGTGTCVVTLGEDASVVADFAKKPEEAGDNGGASGGGSTDGSSGPSVPASTANPSSPPTSAPAPKRVAKKKPLQCKKGFHQVKLKGKVHCAKPKPKPKGKKAKAKRS